MSGAMPAAHGLREHPQCLGFPVGGIPFKMPRPKREMAGHERGTGCLRGMTDSRRSTAQASPRGSPPSLAVIHEPERPAAAPASKCLRGSCHSAEENSPHETRITGKSEHVFT